jgi:hypothetical protein
MFHVAIIIVRVTQQTKISKTSERKAQEGISFTLLFYFEERGKKEGKNFFLFLTFRPFKRKLNS